MPDEDTARKIRANRLREQIERLTAPGNKPKENVRGEGAANESPREFIHRKMRELGSKGESSR
jgi:ERCC4-type nuclease